MKSVDMGENPETVNVQEIVSGSHLPSPFDKDTFYLFKKGIFDNSETSVYMNSQKDFAFLWPTPQVNYAQYHPRVAKLALEKYKKTNEVINCRIEKIKPFFKGNLRVLEVGSHDGAFLKAISNFNSELSLFSAEPDFVSDEERGGSGLIKNYRDLNEIKKEKFDVICFFHVLEHIRDPKEFLSHCHRLLSEKGRLILEVPSMEDPLVALYANPAYVDFYFQEQHPFVYSSQSIVRLLDANRFSIRNSIFHQRYGLENHLTWLTKGKPGGNANFKEIVSSVEKNYKRSLEERKLADSFIAVAEPHFE